MAKLFFFDLSYMSFLLDLDAQSEQLLGDYWHGKFDLVRATVLSKIYLKMYGE